MSVAYVVRASQSPLSESCWENAATRSDNLRHRERRRREVQMLAEGSPIPGQWRVRSLRGHVPPHVSVDQIFGVPEHRCRSDSLDDLQSRAGVHTLRAEL